MVCLFGSGRCWAILAWFRGPSRAGGGPSGATAQRVVSGARRRADLEVIAAHTRGGDVSRSKCQCAIASADPAMAQRGLDTLADLGDRHVIHSMCDPCGRSTELKTHQLIAVYGAEFAIADLKRWLTCRKCGDRPREIRIVYAVSSRE